MAASSVSVVIATFNREEFIRETVLSVLNQKPFGGRIEVIVVDDGSTDRPEAALGPLAAHVIYRRIAHSGRPAVPRNVGIQLATGTYIAFQDSDDLWLPDKLCTQLASFEADPEIVLSYGDVEFITAAGQLEGRRFPEVGQGRDGDVFADLLRNNFIPAQTPLVPRQLVLELGGFDESPALRAKEDYELWLRIASRGRIKYEDRALGRYRIHAGQICVMSVDADMAGYSAVYRRTLRWVDRERRPLVYRRLTETSMSRARAARADSRQRFVLSYAKGVYYSLRRRLVEHSLD